MGIGARVRAKDMVRIMVKVRVRVRVSFWHILLRIRNVLLKVGHSVLGV